MIPQLSSFSPTAECSKCRTFDTVTLVVYRKVGKRQHLCRKCNARFYTEMIDVDANEPTAEHIATIRAANVTLKHLPPNQYPAVDQNSMWERIGHPMRISQIGGMVAVYRCVKCNKSKILRRYQFRNLMSCECVIVAMRDFCQRKAADRRKKKTVSNRPQSIADMARVNGVSPVVAYHRLFGLKWDLQRAVSQPVRKLRKNRKKGDV